MTTSVTQDPRNNGTAWAVGSQSDYNNYVGPGINNNRHNRRICTRRYYEQRPDTYVDTQQIIPSGEFEVCCWFRANVSAPTRGQGFILGAFDTSTDSRLYLAHNYDTGVFQAGVGDKGIASFTSTPSYSDMGWHYLRLLYDGAGTARFIIDNLENITVSGISFTGTIDSLYIGDINSILAVGPMRGDVSGVKIIVGGSLLGDYHNDLSDYGGIVLTNSVSGQPDGILYNGIGWVYDDLSPCLYYNGAAHSDMGNTPTLSSNMWTELIIEIVGGSAADIIYGCQTLNDRWYLGYDFAANKFFGGLGDIPNTGFLSTNTFTPSGRYVLRLEYDGVNGYLYVNGRLERTATPGTFLQPGVNTFLGARNLAGSPTNHGDVRVLSVVTYSNGVIEQAYIKGFGASSNGELANGAAWEWLEYKKRYSLPSTAFADLPATISDDMLLQCVGNTVDNGVNSVSATITGSLTVDLNGFEIEDQNVVSNYLSSSVDVLIVGGVIKTYTTKAAFLIAISDGSAEDLTLYAPNAKSIQTSSGAEALRIAYTGDTDFAAGTDTDCILVPEGSEKSYFDDWPLFHPIQDGPLLLSGSVYYGALLPLGPHINPLVITWNEYFTRKQPSKSEQLKNRIEVLTQPLLPSDSTEEIYKTGQPIELAGGQSLEVVAQYSTQPALTTGVSISVVDNVDDSSYVGGELVISSATYYAWGAEYTITNIDGITGTGNVVIEGTPLKISGEDTIFAEDTDSIDDVGLQKYVLKKNHLIQSTEVAQLIADSLLSGYKDPRKDTTVTWRGNPVVVLGDVITVPEYQRDGFILDGDFKVFKNKISYDGTLKQITDGRKI